MFVQLLGRALRQQISTTRPVSERALQELKRQTWTEGETKEEACPICQEDYAEGDDVALLPCSHDFHHDWCVALRLSVVLNWTRRDQGRGMCYASGERCGENRHVKDSSPTLISTGWMRAFDAVSLYACLSGMIILCL